MATTETWSIADVVDLDRYPLDQPAADAARRVVERCRIALANDGACQLDGFMRPAAVEAVLDEARQLEPIAFQTEATHDVYFEGDDATLAADHPRRVAVRSAKRAIGWNRIGRHSPLSTLYGWDGLTALVAGALQLDELYRDADPVGACSIMFYHPGDELGWHFDRSEFAVTLMLQECEAGGVFEYVPRIRSASDENLAAVRALLDGERSGVLAMSSKPGTLALFQGRYSIHRVSPVLGTRPRINAVLAYASEPGHTMNAITRDLFYGPQDAS
jgi:hypothetical protein